MKAFFRRSQKLVWDLNILDAVPSHYLRSISELLEVRLASIHYLDMSRLECPSALVLWIKAQRVKQWNNSCIE